MQGLNIQRFFRILVLIFLGLFAASYVTGIIPAGAKEMFLSFLRPSAPQSLSDGDVYLNSEKIEPNESWNSAKIVIPVIAVNSLIIMPTSRNLSVLNADLSNGVVHYPGSAIPGTIGNVILFGHSTLLPAHNPAYKVFTRLHELNQGDAISIRSDAREYVYQVKTIRTEKADDAKINLISDKKLLTLSTCNILGGEESRYVVTAEFVKSYSLVN